MISGDKLVLSYILGKWGKLPFAMLFHKVQGCYGGLYLEPNCSLERRARVLIAILLIYRDLLKEDLVCILQLCQNPLSLDCLFFR